MWKHWWSSQPTFCLHLVNILIITACTSRCKVTHIGHTGPSAVPLLPLKEFIQKPKLYKHFNIFHKFFTKGEKKKSVASSHSCWHLFTSASEQEAGAWCETHNSRSGSMEAHWFIQTDPASARTDARESERVRGWKGEREGERVSVKLQLERTRPWGVRGLNGRARGRVPVSLDHAGHDSERWHRVLGRWPSFNPQGELSGCRRGFYLLSNR